MTKIKYNHLNLPVEINFGTDKIEYLYTASGEKIQKKVTEKGVVTLTDYLGGFQYVKGKLSFLPTAEGFFNAETNAYVYQYKDHLGNVRLSYSDKNGDNTIQSSTEIIEETNYYPFGLAHKGYNQKNDALMKDYKYQYNGKEKQEELGLNFYDYGARNYDATIGRWMNVDPLAEQTMEPYSYVGNNPIMFTDPTGMSKEGGENDYLFDKDNNLIGVTYNNNKDRYFKESDKSSTTTAFNYSNGTTKYGEEIKPSFSIIEVINEVEGSVGHSALGYDGNVINYYPTKEDGTTSDFGAGHMWGTELQQVTSSQSDFRDKYPLANSSFVKVDADQKNSLMSDVTNRGSFLRKSDETYNLGSNNCTTNVVNHLTKSGIFNKSEIDVYRPGGLNSALRNSSKATSIIRQSSIGRTARQNISQSLNNVTVNGKRVKK